MKSHLASMASSTVDKADMILIYEESKT